MKTLYLLFLSIPLVAQSTITLDPAVITHCDLNGEGQTRVSWSTTNSGPVTIRLTGPTGRPMTGPMPPTGQVDTLSWVSDGLLFSLVDSGSNELAHVVAAVRCVPGPSAVALAASSYFPLNVGNEWVYRVKSRFGGPSYMDQRVARTQLDSSGVLWFVLTTNSVAEATASTTDVLYRMDTQGRIHTLGQDGSDKIYLDPTGGPATDQNTAIGFGLQTLVGTFPNALAYRVDGGGFFIETGYFVRGIGLTSSVNNITTGSNGGFNQSLDLIFARIDKQIYSVPQPTLEISAETTDLDVGGHSVSNCAIPCYFPACGVAFPTPDPPGTYKPCFEARVRVGGSYTNAGTAGATVDFTLLDPSGNIVDSASSAVAQGLEVTETVLARQLKLYTGTNVPVPPGKYTLHASLKSSGSEVASSTMNLGVR